MELVYEIDTFQNQLTNDWISEERPCISLSCKNILALYKYADDEERYVEICKGAVTTKHLMV